MAVVFLAYVEPVPGRLYAADLEPFQELVRRGHRVTVRTGVKRSSC